MVVKRVPCRRGRLVHRNGHNATGTWFHSDPMSRRRDEWEAAWLEFSGMWSETWKCEL